MTDHNKTPKTEPLMDVTPFSKALEKFATDRDWTQFHSPKNLVMALTGEVGEFTEIFQWMTETQSLAAGMHSESGYSARISKVG